MHRTSSNVFQSLRNKLASGFALAARDGVMDVILSAFAAGIADAEASAEALMNETDPRQANQLLSDFERCLGPDPCGRGLGQLTVEQRQKLAYQRWTARGGQSIPYFLSVAKALGVEITIEEFWPSRAGVLRAGQRLRPEGSQFIWRVHIPGLVSVVKFRTGVSRAAQRLGSFEVSAIECELRRIKPAHTHVVFNYGEA
ncbi:uncharacterized protein YmfQ (DUF2313 family) [Agrobacterium vitis]|nr:uncharacterized protein YmfQ (DUF2313 family) [Agrobacterium vitis]MBE1440559.1 uncharacterized protein YmfQ (DUF2313 family) [Agrobacterium vitis]